MITNKKPHSYITNCTFLVPNDGRPPIFSDDKEGRIVVKLNKVWVIAEEYLTEEMQYQIFRAVNAANKIST